MQAFFMAYQAFTARPDEMLARRGLSRVHHRILFFLARSPALSVTELLACLDVSKQALNTPLRQLQEMQLVISAAAAHDKRMRLLQLSPEGAQLEASLRRAQVKLLQRCLEQAGEQAFAGWLAVNDAMGRHRHRQTGAMPASESNTADHSVAP